MTYFMAVKVYLNLIFCLNFHILTSLGPSSLDMLHGHSKATMLLICNNAAQGILSSFFFKYAGDFFILFFNILHSCASLSFLHVTIFQLFPACLYFLLLEKIMFATREKLFLLTSSSFISIR